MLPQPNPLFRRVWLTKRVNQTESEGGFLQSKASRLSEEERAERYARLRRSLKKGRSPDVIAELEGLAVGQPEDAAVWREVGYLIRHAEAGRLRYDCFRCRGVPLGSGAIESTIRRVLNLRLEGTSLSWKESNAEAVIQLRAAVLSGRWEERLERTRVAMAKDRRTDWDWEQGLRTRILGDLGQYTQ